MIAAGQSESGSSIHNTLSSELVARLNYLEPPRQPKFELQRINASLTMSRLGYSVLESVPYRSIYIRVKPTPVGLSERHSVLRALQRYGDVEVFKKQHVRSPEIRGEEKETVFR